MTNRKNVSLASLAACTAVAVLAFGLATPQANAQVGFGISIGSPGYVDNGYAGAGYVYQRGYWQPDPDGDGNARWIPGGWVVAPYQGGYYGGGYPAQYQGGYYGRGEGHRFRRHDDDDDQ